VKSGRNPGRRRGHVRGALASAVASCLLVACASPRLEVRPQVSASGQPAYELRGTSLDSLRTEVRRLCPAGADVLFQGQAHQRNEAEPGIVRRWTLELLDPPRSEAHMQVVCRG
jgi:hypothetical protein